MQIIVSLRYIPHNLCLAPCNLWLFQKLKIATEILWMRLKRMQVIVRTKENIEYCFSKGGGATLELVCENPKEHIALNRLHFCYFLFTSGKQKSFFQTLLENKNHLCKHFGKTKITFANTSGKRLCFIFYKLKSYSLLHKV